jgi:hypothetical protein
MRRIIIVLYIIALSSKLNGQVVNEKLTGKVSFVSSQNIYVKFRSTEGISVRDTLFIMSNGNMLPVLRVNNLSSESCVCTALASVNFSTDIQVIAIKKINKTKIKNDKIETLLIANPEKKASVDSLKNHYNPVIAKQNIRGSVSAYSYSNYSNTLSPKTTQFRYTISLDAKNIGNSKLSVESYISFRHKMGDWSDVKKDVFNALKIYSLNLRYDLNKTTHISLGRKINQKISSIGATDGLQIEKSLNKFSVGALVGSRPDYMNYGFDKKLFQYGAYIAYSSVTAANYFENSLAFMQQMNNGKTDRRFLYFQHSNSLIKNFYFFSTFEADLYKLRIDTLNNYISENIFNLTGFYLSMRYKMTKKLTITASYDGRKNVMYYETYKAYIDRLLETEMRQSFRLQADYRITRNLTYGMQSGYRYLKSDPHSSKNLYSYVTYNQIPGVKLSITISGTYIESNYLKGKLFGATLSRDFFQGKLYTGIGYRYVDYSYTESLLKTYQNIGEMNLSWQLTRTLSFSINYEGTFEKQNKYNRVYLQIRKRF